MMLDTAISYHRYQFLGYEFLTWLWFLIEHPSKQTFEKDGDLYIGNRIVLENFKKDRRETVTIKGDHADMREGMIAIAKGAYVTETRLRWVVDQQEWIFTLKGKGLQFGSLKVPDSLASERQDEADSFVLEKAFLCDNIIRLLTEIFKIFIKLRVSQTWHSEIVPNIRQWVQNRV